MKFRDRIIDTFGKVSVTDIGGDRIIVSIESRTLLKAGRPITKDNLLMIMQAAQNKVQKSFEGFK